MEKESCHNCKRNTSHGGTCTCNKGMTQVCLGYEKDPRGSLLKGNFRIKLGNEDFIVGEWTKTAYNLKHKNLQGRRKIKICKIDGIAFCEEINDYEVFAEIKYFEKADEEENYETKLCKIKRYLKENNIKNVVMFRKKGAIE